MKEVWIYSEDKKHFVKATKWDIFKREISRWIHRYKIIDSWHKAIIPYKESKYYFKLSKKEYEKAQKICQEKGTISYELIPAGGIGMSVKVKVLKTGEIIDITDVSCW